MCTTVTGPMDLDEANEVKKHFNKLYNTKAKDPSKKKKGWKSSFYFSSCSNFLFFSTSRAPHQPPLFFFAVKGKTVKMSRDDAYDDRGGHDDYADYY